MYTLILLVATSLGYGSAEIHTTVYQSETECIEAVGEMTAYVDQPENLTVTYHCMES